MPSSKFKQYTNIEEINQDLQGPGIIADHTKSETSEKKAEQNENKSNDVVVTGVGGHNIKSVKIDTTQMVTNYQSVKLKTKYLNYNNIQKNFKNKNNIRNSRFKLSELSRASMSVEQEEQLRIETEVQKRLHQRFQELSEKVKTTAQSEGFASGMQVGKEEVLKNIKPHIEDFKNLLNDFENAAHEIAHINEAQIIKLIYYTVKKIVLKEVKEDTDFVRRCIVDVLEKISTKENIKIFISPQAFASVEKLQSDLITTLGQLKNLTIIPDVSLVEGGCRIETDFGDIDASIETQLNNLNVALRQSS